MHNILVLKSSYCTYIFQGLILSLYRFIYSVSYRYIVGDLKCELELEFCFYVLHGGGLYFTTKKPCVSWCIIIIITRWLVPPNSPLWLDIYYIIWSTYVQQASSRFIIYYIVLFLFKFCQIWVNNLRSICL